MATELSIERLEAEASRTSPLSILAAFLILAGIALAIVATISWVLLADKAWDLYSYDLAARDSVQAGDQILDTQATLESYPRWLTSLPFLGIALILVGIGILLRTFVRRVRLRMTVTAIALSYLRDRRPG